MERRMFTTGSKKGNLVNTENYRGITFTPIAAKIYNLLILNRIRPNIDPILRKNQNSSELTDPQTVKY